MTVDRTALLAEVRGALPVSAGGEGAGDTAFDLGARTSAWLTELEAGGPGPGAADLDGLCRQIDVRHRLSGRYLAGWKRTDPETDATAPVVAATVAVLLAVAQRGTDAGRDLKLVNSALKALELHDDPPGAPALRGWAVELLDRATAVAG